MTADPGVHVPSLPVHGGAGAVRVRARAWVATDRQRMTTDDDTGQEAGTTDDAPNPWGDAPPIDGFERLDRAALRRDGLGGR